MAAAVAAIATDKAADKEIRKPKKTKRRGRREELPNFSLRPLRLISYRVVSVGLTADMFCTFVFGEAVVARYVEPAGLFRDSGPLSAKN
jgi:hypothetical protein